MYPEMRKKTTEKAHRIAKKLHSRDLVALYAIYKYKEETSLTDATVFFTCQNFTDWVSISSRCDTLDSLLEKGCSRNQVQFPVSESQILLDRPLGKITDDANSTQISPQKMSLKLRPGIQLRVSEINNLEIGSYCQKNIKGDFCVCVCFVSTGSVETFQVKVQPTADYPVDMYYMMDLSASLIDDLKMIKDLGSSLSREMSKLTSNFQMGFGSFVEKPVLPYIKITEKELANPCRCLIDLKARK